MDRNGNHREQSWLDTYYGALEFFYWEPQHLGRLKNPASKLDSVAKVKSRLRTLEVPLNHNLDQFFRLAPQELRRALFQRAFGSDFGDPLLLHGPRGLDDVLDLRGVVQPDFLFESAIDVASIEMKLGSKSSVQQVLKYALLGLAIELKRMAPRRHSLLMLGRGPFAALWKERFTDIASLRAALVTSDTAAFLASRAAWFTPQAQRFSEIVQETRISWLTYGQLADFLRSVCPSEHDMSPGAEVYRNLVRGMLNELSVRQLES